jgi:hypothetical protein
VGKINRNAEKYSIRGKLPLNRVPDKQTVNVLTALYFGAVGIAALYDHGGAQEGGANAGG